MRVGELIGVEYLYNQTGKVLKMAEPEVDDADTEQVEEEIIVDDEGFIDESTEYDPIVGHFIEDFDTKIIDTVEVDVPMTPAPEINTATTVPAIDISPTVSGSPRVGLSTIPPASTEPSLTDRDEADMVCSQVISIFTLLGFFKN